jgi:transcriptional regulator GlxA family with amidase domain
MSTSRTQDHPAGLAAPDPEGLRHTHQDDPAHVLGRRGVVRGHAVTAVDVLRSRLAEPWTLSALAKEVHLSRSQLVRAFDATVGMSPMTFLKHMRVQQMARLLSSTDLSIAEAARLVGWTDPNYASRCFHAAYGISPTDFRRRQTTPRLTAPSSVEVRRARLRAYADRRV